MAILIKLQDICLYALLLAAIFISLARKYDKEAKKHGKRPPLAAGSWPIWGHLHLLGADQLQHKVLAAMADKHGPIFSIKLGVKEAVVVSSWEVAKECFTTNDKVFSSRPRSLAVKIMGYDHLMPGFAPYGQYWRHMRKLIAIKLLSNRQLELLKHVRNTEINFFVKELYDLSVKNGKGSVVEMKQRFGDLAMNIIVRMLAGKRYFGTVECGDEESRRCQKALGDFFCLAGLFLASDNIPFLGWMDFLKGYVGEMKRIERELDSVFSRWVNEHRKKRLQGTINTEEQDFIHVMLSSMDDGKNSAADTDTIIKATCLSLILGGNDTTVVTLTWAAALLLNNRTVLQKAQDELDIHVGKHRQVQDEDIKHLVYLQAIVKETMRLHAALPLSASREAMEDCTVAGYHVPAGTRLLVNLWKIHRDPNIWSNPLEFQPERFLRENANLDFRGQDFEYMPFGAGRRMCPGVSLGLQVVQLTLARLLHGFELGTICDAPMDMTESPGMTVPKATPLQVVLSPRLPSKIYEC